MTPRRPLSRALVVLVAGGLALAGAVSSAPEAGAVVAQTTVQSITLTAGDTSLVGAQLTTLTVRAHLTDPAGVFPATNEGEGDGVSYFPCPCVVVAAVDAGGRDVALPAGAPTWRTVPLRLAAGGTPQDGVWVGTTVLGAADGAYWRAVTIRAGTLHVPWTTMGADFVPVDAAVSASSALRVTGSDWPVLTLLLPSRAIAGSPFVLRGTLRLSSSHRPVTGARLVVRANVDYGCGPGYPKQPQGLSGVRTSSTGTWAIATSIYASAWCVQYGSNRWGDLVQETDRYGRYLVPVVTARTSSTSVRRGTTVLLSGTTTPYGYLSLSRYYSGSWHVIAHPAITSCTTVPYLYPPRCSYRLRFVPRTGTWRYRVTVTGAGDFPAAGPVLTVRAW